jgi:hypothetical protein
LEQWHEQFAAAEPCSSGGGGGGDGGGGYCRNINGDLPIHVLCRDAQVPLHAICFLLEQEQQEQQQQQTRDYNHHHNSSGSSSMVATRSNNTQHGHYFPFRTAAMSDASLDVIFYLLQLWPDALVQLLPRPNSSSGGSSSSSCRVDSEQHEIGEGPTKKESQNEPSVSLSLDHPSD